MITIKIILFNGLLTAEIVEELISNQGDRYSTRAEVRITVPEDLTRLATQYDLSPRNYDWGTNLEAFRFYLHEVEQKETNSKHWEPQIAMEQYLRSDFGPFIDLLDGKTFAEISSLNLPTNLNSETLDTLRLIRKIIILSAELGPLLPDQEKLLALEKLRTLSKEIDSLLQISTFLQQNYANFEKIVNTFKVIKDEILRILAPFIATKESSDTVEKVNSLITSGNETISESNRLLNLMRDQEIRNGTDKAATFYTKQAHRSFLTSLAFLAGLGVTVGGLVCYLINHHSDIITWKSITLSQALSIDLPRLSYLSVFAFGIAFLA